MKNKCKICAGSTKTLTKNLFDDRYGYPGNFSVLVCDKCGFGQISPAFKNEELSNLYTNFYPRQKQTAKDAIREATFEPTLKYKMKSYLFGTNNVCHQLVRPRTKVLDLGCGSGYSLIELQKINCEAYGTEADNNVLEIAKELKINISNDISEIPAKMKFDYITASQVLEHVPDPSAYIKEVMTRLNENGQLIFSFPNLSSFGRVIWKNKWINWHVPYHQNFFSRKNIKLLASKCGLEIKSIRTVTPNVWTQLQLAKLFYANNNGKKNYLWDVNKDRKKSFSRYLVSLIVLLSYIVPIVPNRLIDTFGWGESMIVTLEKKRK